MNSTWYARNAGAALEAVVGRAVEAGVEGVEQEGVAIDREALSRNYLSAKVVLLSTSALGAAETVACSANIETADDAAFTVNAGDLGPDAHQDAQTLVNVPVANEAVDGATPSKVTSLNVDLSGARRYVRVVFTFTPSSTGTVDAGAVVIFAGADGELLFDK